MELFDLGFANLFYGLLICLSLLVFGAIRGSVGDMEIRFSSSPPRLCKSSVGLVESGLRSHTVLSAPYNCVRVEVTDGLEFDVAEHSCRYLFQESTARLNGRCGTFTARTPVYE